MTGCQRSRPVQQETVKRYDRAGEPERLQRVPKYRPTLVDPNRDYLPKRRAEEPGIPVQQLLREIRELDYQGGSNLLVRYINQGRLDSDRPAPVTPPGRRRSGCRALPLHLLTSAPIGEHADSGERTGAASGLSAQRATAPPD